MQTHRGPQGSGGPRRSACLLLAAGAVALLAAAGCGGSQAPAPTTAQAARSPCPPLIPGAEATVQERAPDVVVCRYRRDDRALAQVTLDRAPQASFRFERTVVERSQAHLGDDRAQLPQEVTGVGRGADWIAAPRTLLATDDVTLVTVALLGPARSGAADRATAVAVARTALR